MLCDRCKREIKEYCARCKVELTSQNRTKKVMFQNSYGKSFFCEKCADRFLGRGKHDG